MTKKRKEGYKECTKCKKSLPSNTDYFHRDSYKKDGLNPSCKSCIYEKKSAEELNKQRAIRRKNLEEEYLGKTFSYWSVIGVSENKRDKRHIFYKCKCVCGVERDVRKTALKNKRSTSCGCNGSLQIKGRVYGRLTATGNAYRRDGRIYVRVLCSCDTTKEVLKQSLDSGATVSCGCYNKHILKSRTGELNHNYKPSLTDEQRIKNNSRGSQSDYQRIRRLVLKRDCNTCQCCGLCRDKNMRVHHLNGWHWFPEGRYSEDNLVTLCDMCHDIENEYSFHNVYGNGDNTEKQFKDWLCKYQSYMIRKRKGNS